MVGESDNAFKRFGHLKIFKMAGRHLAFGPTGMAPFDLPSPKTSHRSKHEGDRLTRCRVMAI